MNTPSHKIESPRESAEDPRPSLLAPTYKPPNDAIRVGMLTFVTKALPIAGVNAVNDHLSARRSDSVAGVDIYYLPAVRHFRVQRFGPEVRDARPKMIHESRVEFWEPW
jgi:hypothetical protein